MFCRNCGNTMSDSALFCPKCGTKVAKKAEPETGDTGASAVDSVQPVPAAPVQTPPVQPDPTYEMPAAPKKKSILIPVLLISLVGVLLLAVIGVGIYDFLRTKEFDAVVAQFEEFPKGVASLGKFQSDYDTLLADSQDAASHFRFWQYEGYVQEMSSLSDEVDSMNEAVAAYREEYNSVVQEIENGSKYIMDDYEADYQSAKSALEESLQEFDEKSCKKNSEAFQTMRDKIVNGNKEKADEAVKNAKEIKSAYSGYNTHPFEEYMIGDLTSRIESDADALDYIQLNEDYQALSEWADRFSAATSSSEQVEKYVQADVSEKNKVKLYINSYDYETYNFKLEDFIIYEKYNNQWNECQAVDISQIEGMLSMDIVADISGSMRYDFYDMQCAIEGFVNGTHSDTVLGLSTIGSIYERYQEFTTNKTQITNSVWDLECYGLTSLYQSLYSSVVYTASAEGARCVVAFTDGNNEPYGAGYDYDAQDVIDVSLYYQVPVYIIGLGTYLDSSELRYIAESTGGAYYANMSVSNLQNVYMDIYEAQGRMYQLSYQTQVPNNVDRDVYVLYADSSKNLGIRIESELNAEALQSAYASAGFNSSDLTAYYTSSKYLSSDDLAKLGDDLEAVQTIINIYYSKNGYQFGDSENGQKQLQKMINLGVISQNGTLDGNTVTAILKQDPILWQNFSALYNYRYEIIYKTALDIYQYNPGIAYEDLRSQVSQHYGEENEKRFDPVISAAWKNIRAGL